MNAIGFNRDRAACAATGIRSVADMHESTRSRRRFQPGDPAQGMGAVRPAHVRFGPQTSADFRPLGRTEDAAAVVVVELRAAHTGGLTRGAEYILGWSPSSCRYSPGPTLTYAL